MQRQVSAECSEVTGTSAGMIVNVVQGNHQAAQYHHLTLEVGRHTLFRLALKGESTKGEIYPGGFEINCGRWVKTLTPENVTTALDKA